MLWAILPLPSLQRLPVRPRAAAKYIAVAPTDTLKRNSLERIQHGETEATSGDALEKRPTTLRKISDNLEKRVQAQLCSGATILTMTPRVAKGSPPCRLEFIYFYRQWALRATLPACETHQSPFTIAKTMTPSISLVGIGIRVFSGERLYQLSLGDWQL